MAVRVERNFRRYGGRIQKLDNIIESCMIDGLRLLSSPQGELVF